MESEEQLLASALKTGTAARWKATEQEKQGKETQHTQAQVGSGMKKWVHKESNTYKEQGHQYGNKSKEKHGV
eukprot:9844633-Prorocentrum_lima.AAC.1